MDQNPPGSGQQQQQPKYDPQHGGHYGMFPSSHIIILASKYWLLAVAHGQCHTRLCIARGESTS